MAESTTKNQGEESSGSNGTMSTVMKVVFGVVVVVIVVSLIYYGVQAYNRSNKSAVSSEDASGQGQQEGDAERGKGSGVASNRSRSELVEKSENGAARDSAFNLVNRKEQRA